MNKELIEIVKSAGDILRERFYSTSKVMEKEPKDLVTQVDLEIEEYIKNAISKIYKDAYFYGEEGGYSGKESDHLFVIDPIDGTTNFIFGVPYFAISIAEIIDEKVVSAIVYNPMTKDLYHADSSGAYLNNKLISVSNRTLIKDSYVIFGFSVNKKNIDKYEEDFPEAFISSKKGLPLLSPSLNLCLVAQGKADAFIDFGCSFEGQVAGAYILEKAGGRLYNYDKSLYDYKLTGIIALNDKIILQ